MIIFDTETTGLPQAEQAGLAQQPFIIEFAAIKVRLDWTEIGTLTFLAKPPIPLDPEIVKSTHITDAMLADQLPFVAHLPKVVDFFLGEKYLIAHNAQFDVTMLRLELLRVGRQTSFPWPPVQICTVESSQHLQGYRLSLDKLYKLATGKDHTSAHRAMADAHATLEAGRWLYQQGHLKIKLEGSTSCLEKTLVPKSKLKPKLQKSR